MVIFYLRIHRKKWLITGQLNSGLAIRSNKIFNLQNKIWKLNLNACLQMEKETIQQQIMQFGQEKYDRWVLHNVVDGNIISNILSIQIMEALITKKFAL